MKRRITAAICAGALALSLSACSNGESDSSESGSTATSTATQDTQEAPKVVVSSKGMPTVTLGEMPTFTFPDSEPPSTIQVAIVEEGSGPEISRTDWVSARYLGQVWAAAEPFDSSYERGTLLTLPLTQLVSGWGWGLEGRHVGDKVIVSIPPEYGYGSDGQPSAGISGTDTMVFFIEIVDAWGANASGESTAKVELEPAALPVEYEAAVGEPVIKITVKDDAPSPSELKVDVIARGSGPALKEGDIFFYQVAQAYWDNSVGVTTWSTQDAEGAGVQQGEIATDTLFNGLIGVPVGSRVLMSVPGTAADAESSSSEVPPVAAILDVVALQPSE